MTRNNLSLYDDGRIKVSYLRDSVEEHVLIVPLFGRDNYSCILQRGILEELAKTKPSDLKGKIHAIDPLLSDSLTLPDFPNLSFALTQARITDLEQQVSELIVPDDTIPF